LLGYLLLLVLLVSMPEPNLDRFTSRRSTAYANRGMVATSQPLASQVGVSTLEDGGNAFDAAVATAAALNVVEPTSTGLGGDVFALYKTADGEVGAMRSCGGAPAEATLENVREAVAAEEDVDPEDAEMPETGAQAVTVPGTARGWELTAEKFGNKSLGDLLQPAIHYAKEGYPVSEVVSAQWQHGEELFESEHAREAFLFDGEAPSTGQQVSLPRLGESMETIAEEGADAFYEGEIGENIAAEVQSEGGFLTTEDLAAFEPELLDPVSTTYNGAEIYELPPNNQGLIALEALNLAEEVGAADHPLDSPERIHYFAEALKVAFHDGHRYITDPEYEDHPPLAAKSWAEERAELIGEEANHDVSFGVEAEPLERMKARGAGHLYWLDDNRDALYHAGGGVLRAGAAGADDYVGSEIDLTVNYRFNRHLDLLVGYSHFFAGDFLEETGSSADVDFAYVQTRLLF
jgi:gamma-glutamyltranspeptidase/glutathione hydrolase